MRAAIAEQRVERKGQHGHNHNRNHRDVLIAAKETKGGTHGRKLLPFGCF